MTPELAFLLNQAFQHFQNGRIDSAEGLLNKALKIQSRNFDALHLLGVIKGIQNKHEEAKILLKKAVQINPNDGFVHFNLAKSLSEIGRDAESLAHHKKAAQLLPNDPEVWINYGKSLDHLKQAEEALACYEKALALDPNHAEALANRGASLYELYRHEEGLSSLEKALTLNPSLAAAWHSYGNALHELKRDGEALRSYEQAIAIKPDFAEAHMSRGHLLTKFKEWESAMASYEQAIALKPDIAYGYGDRLHIKMLLCNWANFDEEISVLTKKIESPSPQPAARPFVTLTVPISPAQQKKCTELSVTQSVTPTTFPSSAASKGKIKIGYFSADFRNHPVGHLTAGLFEAHDRSQFEIYGFGLLPSENSALGLRLSNAFDHFVDLSPLALPAAIESVREYGLDIAIDLNGYTQNNQAEIFNHRVAPIQVNYLGYAGTMGADFIDYIVADNIVIPSNHAEFYTEKVAYLPHSYFISSYQENSALPSRTRQSENLPLNSFVFCGFNNSYKITPDVFDIWMRLLNKVEGSVLWLSKQSSTVTNNLRQEAANRGVAGERLIFAERVESRDEHLQRQALADLFLDTFHYNAHTTAADALWAGLPVLTRAGGSFPARVAASLLTALGLPELITQTSEEYEALALTLATHPEKLSAIKEKLAQNRVSQPLFDTKLTTRHLEQAYRQMYERQQQGLPPDHIHVPA